MLSENHTLTSEEAKTPIGEKFQHLQECVRREKEVMTGCWYEIGLRYQQLYSEYRYVLLETGRTDALSYKSKVGGGASGANTRRGDGSSSGAVSGPKSGVAGKAHAQPVQKYKGRERRRPSATE